mmetsp:Transcript_10304/g.22073  ORF Transcript_10304/g.22073 Transcript_10304/m.22073 type:complete len:204 (-) Transcript_10304:619-1230(-)
MYPKKYALSSAPATRMTIMLTNRPHRPARKAYIQSRTTPTTTTPNNVENFANRETSSPNRSKYTSLDRSLPIPSEAPESNPTPPPVSATIAASRPLPCISRKTIPTSTTTSPTRTEEDPPSTPLIPYASWTIASNPGPSVENPPWPGRITITPPTDFARHPINQYSTPSYPTSTPNPSWKPVAPENSRSKSGRRSMDASSSGI